MLASHQPHSGDLQSTAKAGTGRQLALVVIWLLSVLALLAWRSGDYYSGGIDPVVAAKGVLSLVALGIAFWLWSSRPKVNVLGLPSVTLVAIYLIVSVFGAWANGGISGSLVIAVRVAIIQATVMFVVSCTPVRQVLQTFFGALAGIGICLAATGVRTFVEKGRLSGGFMSVSPNELALLLGLPTLALVWCLLEGYGSVPAVALLIPLGGFTIMTGSRTGLIGLVAGLALLLLLARQLRLGAVVSGLVAIPVAFYLMAFSPWLSNYFERSGQGRITTLNSRTIAWTSAFSSPKGWWEEWFGSGLAVKTVSVTGTYWDTQVLDSSWVSAYVQAGWLGILILALWAVTVTVGAVMTARPARSLLVAGVVYLLIRSTLGNGLIDAHILFLMMFVMATVAESKRAGSDGRSADQRGIGAIDGSERSATP